MQGSRKIQMQILCDQQYTLIDVFYQPKGHRKGRMEQILPSYQ